MIYLRTGANGSCKSLFTLHDVRKLQLETGRPVCFFVGDDKDPGRRYVKVKPETMAEFGWLTCRFEDWWDQPDGTTVAGAGPSCNHLVGFSRTPAIPAKPR